MYHMFLLLILSVSFLNFSINCNVQNVSVYESNLIQHVQDSILRAEQHISKLSEDVLNVPGMTSRKVKCLLNNLCSLPNTSYLEIGVWKGATFTAALYGNQDSIYEAVAIDNWSMFGGPFNIFKGYCERFIKNINYHFYSHDSFTISKEALFKKKINIYFYDGDHSVEAQEKAFTYYDDLFEESFIAIIDDWRWPSVLTGTRNAFSALKYTVIKEWELHSNRENDANLWWNGIFVAVIRRPNHLQ